MDATAVVSAKETSAKQEGGRSFARAIQGPQAGVRSALARAAQVRLGSGMSELPGREAGRSPSHSDQAQGEHSR